MFHRAKKSTKLTIECIDAYNANHDVDPFGFDVTTSEINSLEELTTLHHSLKAAHAKDLAEHNKIHKVEFKINGVVNGEKLHDLKIVGLEKLQEFITSHTPQTHHAKSKHPTLGIIMPML